MKLEHKIQDFIQFVLTHKLPHMLKRKSDKELIELYNIYSPEYFVKGESLLRCIHGSIVVYVVGEELKRRHPNNEVIQRWNYDKPLNLMKLLL